MIGDIHLWEWRSDNQAFETFTKVAATLNGAAAEGEVPDGQVTALDVYDSRVTEGRHGRIAASFDSRVVTVCFLPASVKFLGNLDLLVFKANGGIIHQLDQRTGAIKRNDPVEGNFLAHVCVDKSQDAFMVWTGKSFDMYRLTDQQHLRAFRTGDRPSYVPKQARFIEDGKLVLAGSESGGAVLYEAASGTQVQTLAYKSKRPVQIVAATSTNEHHFVAIASSALAELNDVEVYYKQLPVVKAKNVIFCLDKDWTLSIKLSSLLYAIGYWVVVLLVITGLYTLLALFVTNTDIPVTGGWYHYDLPSSIGTLFQQLHVVAQDSASGDVVFADVPDGAAEGFAQDLATADVVFPGVPDGAVDGFAQDGSSLLGSAQDGAVMDRSGQGVVAWGGFTGDEIAHSVVVYYWPICRPPD
ncbi:hypothetical protein D9758_012548 [Tetrapyrgos nigripes]|uniref:Uncharacterized protein n=1 Tax=Tetrapyrgos nigripes TaxID=182062 RepID=A0A8H5G337_9AGAR|nr:hypothetical protein D9758_012548 [Tetrapyrgos nigripes]